VDGECSEFGYESESVDWSSPKVWVETPLVTPRPFIDAEEDDMVLIYPAFVPNEWCQ
jgi:hypothetical protein